MYNEYIDKELQKYQVNDILGLSDAIREIGQKLVLSALFKCHAFENIVFYGGTSLRLVHHIDRFSEDLDFTLSHQGALVSMKDFEEPIIQEFNKYGIDAHITSKPTYDQGEILRRYIKFPLLDIINDYYLSRGYACNKEQLITIKFEVDNGYNPGATYEEINLDFPNSSKVLVYDFPSLFGGKLCAVINRNWKSRVKGRDFYDYLFYTNNNVLVNLEYVKNKMNLDSLTLDDLRNSLLTKFNSVDYESAKKDVAGFIFDKSQLDKWNAELFISTLKDLKCI